MKLKEINTNMGIMYLMLDDNMEIIDEINRFFKYLQACGKSPNTIRSYGYHLKLFYEYCNINGYSPKNIFQDPENKPVDILTGFMIWLQYPTQNRKVIHMCIDKPKRSNSTVNTIMAAVLSFYEYLSSNGEIDELPVYRFQHTQATYKTFLSELMHHDLCKKKSILKKKSYQKPIKALKRSQYVELIKLCECRRDKLLVAFMFEGGMRLSEVLGFHIKDLTQLEDGIVYIVPRENNENGARVKQYAGGVIKLPDYVVDILVDYISEDIGEIDTDYLFLTQKGKNKGKALKAYAVEKLFQKFSKKLGYKVHPHMLRHGFATEKLEAGWSMTDIQAYLRHKSINSTEIYAVYSDNLKKEKMRNFLYKYSKEMKAIANEIQ